MSALEQASSLASGHNSKVERSFTEHRLHVDVKLKKELDIYVKISGRNGYETAD